MINYSKEIEEGKTIYDVIVAGGGPAGCAAALAAARGGSSVLLIESLGQLGGTATSGLVSHWLGGRSVDCRQWIVGGIFKELATEAAEAGFALLPEPEADGTHSPFGWGGAGGTLTAGVPFDPFRMAEFLDRKILAAGVNILLATQVVDAIVREGLISHLIIHNKSGFCAVQAKTFIDATGDADVVALSGCEYLIGQGQEQGVAPATLQLHVDNVDQEELTGYINLYDCTRFLKEIQQWKIEGKWHADYDRLITVQLERTGLFMVNTSRICGVDGTDGVSITDGYIRARKDTMRLFDFLREHVPGFHNAHIKAVAPMLGIRESRRLKGEFVLTVNDLLSGKEFDDTIGYSGYGWDMPDPERPSFQPMHENGHEIRDGLVPIPFRIMIPSPAHNLLCPGRAVSAEREVLGPLRVMAPCMAMGQAAGTAAVMLVKADTNNFESIDIPVLQDNLREQGAVL
ncbi:MAG: FAD-dependent oxidoreductase [Kiritimatiellia bacterium]